MKSLVRVALAGFVGVVSFSWMQVAEARVLVGVRGGQYLDIGESDEDEPYVGVELIAGITKHIYFNPNVEYVFVEKAKVGTGNLDFHLDLPVTEDFHLWAGAGLAVVYTDPDGAPKSDTDLGLNLLAGVGFHAGTVIPYGQLKLLVLDDYEELVWAVGIRF